jgi:predicted dehydrogenase
MSDRFKIAMLGAGAWASICMRSLKEIPEIEVIGCYCRTPEKREEFAREIGCQAAASEDELFDMPGLDAVAVLTPNFTHHDQVLRIAARGLHVFVEKPMANSVAECREMIDAARKASVVMFLGHNSRRELRFRKIKELLDGGKVGRPVMAEINYTSEAGLGKRLGGWRYDTENTPAVALSQIGIHAIDIMHYLLGYTEEVQAWIRNVGMDDGIEDVCLARMLMPDNVSTMFINAYSVPRIRNVAVMGTGGNLFSDHEMRIQYQPVGSIDREIIEVERNDTVLEEFAEFMKCCRDGSKPETDGETGLAAIAVMQAMLDSSRNGGRIEAATIG